MAKNITFRLTVTLLVLISIFVKVQYAQAAKHKVNPFTPQYYCTSAYPTAYRVVDQFSLVETSTSGFTKNQTNKTIILTLPAGFEFNPAVVGDTVRYIPGRDITAISSPVVTATTITVTLSTKNAYTGYDALYFEGFEIRATAAGSGILARLSSNRGTFKVNGSTSTPAETESFGFLYSNTPMVLDSSKVVQDITVPISRNCRHSEILEIAMYVDNVCPAEITQFVFSTAGDPGYSENPAVNIEEAAVYCTDTSRGFVANNLVGTSLTPSGAFTINCSYFLNKGPGTYYFYLTYEVSALATVGEILDASLTSFTFDGAVIVDADDPNPTGTRTIDDNCDQPDMPNPQPNMTLIPAGSYIIPMDNTKQSETAAPFNVKAYGLIHQLLLNDMPVQWAIKSGKAKGDIDFSANVAKVYPAPAGAAIEDFWASAFIVDSAYVNHAVNPFVLSADEVVQAFGNSVAVYQLQEDVIVDIRYEIYQRPKIAVFNNGYDPGVLSVVFDAAEIDNYVEISAGVFPGLEECYTFCCEPHWDGADPETQEITDKVGEFVRTGGNFYAQCLGVETYEDHQLFQSTAGVDIDNTDVFHEYYNADLAYMQVDGEVQRNQAGSQEKWRLTNGSSWVNGFYYAISSDIDIEHIVASGTKVTNVDSVGGNVYYFGGHEYLSAASITKINAMRLMLNASLIPSGKPTQFDLFPGDEITICAGESTTLGGSPTGPPGATYQWDPSESLDIPTSANPVATPADTTEYQVLSKSGGCQVGPRSVIVNVAQPSVVTCAPDDEICFSDLSYAIGGSVTNAPGQLWTTSGDGTFDDDSQIFTNYNPGPTDKSSGTVTLTLSASGACNETSDDLILTILPLEDPTVSDDFTMRAGCVDSLIAYNYQEGTITWAAVPASVLYDSYLSCTAGCDTVLITAPAVFPAFIDYQVTGKPISGCPDAFTSDIVRVSFVNPLTAEITPEEPGVCSGDASTPLTANGHDGSAPYTFKWNTTSTLQTIPGSVEGWYWVDVSDNTQCGSARDSVWLTVFGSPISADAGADQDVCEDNPSVTLDGTIVEAGGGIWTGGDGIFTPDDTDPHADYTPSAGEITAGSVTLMLSATDTAGCDGDFSQMTINIFPVATVTAGIDATICADETFVCQGNFGGSTSEITWTTSGDGTFDDEHDKNAVYTPGNDEKPMVSQISQLPPTTRLVLAIQ
ncbi:MAG: hypothetical protein KKD31_07495 [Bacteroidetes bacterium]|nr:hypothetical protein [Bacteroidota bacterium]